VLELEQEKIKVEQINRELEQRVEERTRKLEIANTQLLRAQKMEAVGTLAGGVAHDLNNVLAGIVGYPELLLGIIPREPSFALIRKYISTMQRSGEKAAAIVQELLTLARRGVKITDVVNLNQVISEFIESPELEKIFSNNPKLKVETQLDENLLNIFGSSVQLSKVLLNLISNAAEAMPGGGKLVVQTGKRQRDGRKWVLTSVADTGDGISEKHKARIFEPFFTTRSDQGGTGLGLSVSYSIVSNHGGIIEVDSTKGKGTQFSVWLPY